MACSWLYWAGLSGPLDDSWEGRDGGRWNEDGEYFVVTISQNACSETSLKKFLFCSQT